MSNDDNKQPDKRDYIEQQAERARARKHQVGWPFVLLFSLLLACVGFAIFVIEFYQ
jgi:hypothetical protein